MKKHISTLAIFLVAATSASLAHAQGHYKSFIVSTYATQGTVQSLMSGRMDPAVTWSNLTRNLKVDKIYIEVMRNHTLVDEAGLDKLKKFYQDQGVQVCGGLAFSVSESYGFQSFDYSDPENRAFATNAVGMAARHFDEILLDDYFFFDRKTDYDIKAKGDKTWTQYRLEAMRDAAKNLIVNIAKAANPKCKVVIKMANWYDQYAGMGNDTEMVPFIADGMFSGTESRTWVGQEQHLQPYLSYDIIRFVDNLKPGVEKGGWVDQGGANPIDRYAEQVLDTVFARAPEMCCFNYSGMIGGGFGGGFAGTNAASANDAASTNAPRGFGGRGFGGGGFGGNRPWSDQPTSLNLSEVQKTVPAGQNATFADIAGYTLGQVDKVLAKVGKPVGIKCYTPYHATGEEFLHDYLGMIGLPMDIFPYFPTNADTVLLTEQAKFDPDIIQKIKAQLEAGKTVVITSGLLRAMKGKGIEDICEINATGATVPVRRFGGGLVGGRGGRGGARGGADGQVADPNAVQRDILIPEIYYANVITHDAWGDVLGVSPGGTTYPIVLSCDYSNGKLYVLTIPNDYADLYALPQSVLGAIRSLVGSAEPVRLDSAPAQVALFRYDNNAFIVQNYLATNAEVTVSVAGNVGTDP